MPAEAPYKVRDRRRLFGAPDTVSFSEPVRDKFKGQRRWYSHYDTDSPRLIGRESRRTLLTLGRVLYQNASIVRGALNEMASLATSSFIPQFDGQDADWGDAAEDWLYDHDRVCDVRGAPYCMDSINRLIVLSVLRDGDCFVLLTEAENGWPMFQVVPSHRVGCRDGEPNIIEVGPWAGNMLVDGAVVNAFGRAVAYKVLGDDPADDRFIDTASLLPVFAPDWVDQVRGISALASALIDFQDIHESRRLELVAQKLLAALTLVESNETGMSDTAAEIVRTAATTDVPGDITYSQEYYGGEVRYFRAGTGSSIQPVVGDRPTANQREFCDSIVRQALHGLGWSYDFSLDPTGAGGANSRLVIEKVNARLAEIRNKMLGPVRRVMDGYRIAKAIKLRLLPASDEWMKWAYQGPAKVTADAKHASDVAKQELQLGLTTLRKAAAERGEWWQDLIDQKLTEAEYIVSEADKRGIPLTMIQMLTPNGNGQDTPQDDALEDTETDAPEE